VRITEPPEDDVPSPVEAPVPEVAGCVQSAAAGALQHGVQLDWHSHSHGSQQRRIQKRQADAVSIDIEPINVQMSTSCAIRRMAEFSQVFNSGSVADEVVRIPKRDECPCHSRTSLYANLRKIALQLIGHDCEAPSPSRPVVPFGLAD
jgi:hypothetical protein